MNLLAFDFEGLLGNNSTKLIRELFRWYNEI